MDQTLGIGSRVEFYAGKGLLLEERFGEIVGTSRLLNGCFEVRWDDGLVSAAPPSGFARPNALPSIRRNRGGAVRTFNLRRTSSRLNPRGRRRPIFPAVSTSSAVPALCHRGIYELLQHLPDGQALEVFRVQRRTEFEVFGGVERKDFRILCRLREETGDEVVAYRALLTLRVGILAIHAQHDTGALLLAALLRTVEETLCFDRRRPSHDGGGGIRAHLHPMASRRNVAS